MKIIYKVEGSSLIETVIAITIITICSMIGTLVYTSILTQTPTVKKYEWSNEVSKFMEEIYLSNEFTTINKKYNGYSIESRLSSKDAGENLMSIEFLIISPKDTVLLPMLLFKINNHEG